MSQLTSHQKYPFKWVRKIIAYLKTIELPKHKNVPIYKVVLSLMKQIKMVGIAERSSILSFNIIMSIPPSLMFIFAFGPLIPFISNKFHKEILFIIKSITPDTPTYQNLSVIINDLFHKPKAIYSLSFFLFLFFASNATIGMMKTFDKSIEHKRKRHIVMYRLVSIVITLILLFSFILFVGLLSFEKILFLKIMNTFHIAPNKIKTIIDICRNVLLSFFLLFNVSFIYKYTPSVQKKWKFFSTGSVFATVSILLMIVLFHYWTKNYMLYHKTYGALGTLIFVLTLIYIFSYILLVGLEINVSIDMVQEEQRKKQSLPTTK